MAETKNTFLKGRMNQDLDSRILPNGEYREAINLLISRSEGSTVGEFENVLGNTDYSLQGSLGFVIGHVVDETNNLVYLFTTNYSNSEGLIAPTTSTCTILQFDLTNPTTPTILVSGYWLNFNSAFPIYGVNIMEELLFFTDNLNQPRRINIITARNSASAYSTESQISVAKYYPYDALIPLERTSAFVAAQGVGNTTTKITTTALLPNVRVGDVVTDNNKTSFSTLEINNDTPVVKVIKIVSATEFDVAPAIGNGGGTAGALSTGLKIDFSRTSMENRSDQYLANYSIQTNGANFGGNTIIRISADASLGGVPRVGDIVTNLTSPNNVPNPANPTAAAKFNLRITQISISNVDNPLGNTGRWTITFDGDQTAGGTVTGFSPSDQVLIASNPLYDPNFPGDTKILEDKFVRFSYRFRYNDNEYSLIAPFTQAMFIPKQHGEFLLGQIDQKSTRDNANTEPGINNYYQDEVDAYTSTILQWFENDIDTVGLKIPLPTSLTELQTIYNVKELDILYKESDGLAIKVLDTIDVDDITSAQLTTVQYDDFINGLENKIFYDYAYTSNKPYKTLAESQTTRVYDKVPVKALAQEMVGNRIVYGNFLQRQNPPENIDYTVSVTNSDAQTSDFSTEYPFQNVKQNRTYQVGFVLSDYYGRQSDVILSSQDSNENSLGSSIYLPYRVASDATSYPVIDWLGQNLALTIQEAIGSNTDIGLYREQGHITTFTVTNAGGSTYELNQTYSTTGGTGSGCTIRVGTLNGGPPGKVTSCTIVTAGVGYTAGDVLTIKNNLGVGTAQITVSADGVGTANPLGWYSYKVVVKQQEQEYYNVYLPGFVNGLPVQNQRVGNITRPVTGALTLEEVDTQRGKIAFSTILGDNLNKIPRNLTEVGPTDNEYNSDEIFYVRVNNPNSTSATNSRNSQYYPGNLSQNVLNLATVRETELAAVPFVGFNAGNPSTGLQGEYDSVLGITNQGLQPFGGQTAEDIVANTPTGSIPWGDVSSVQSFYGADQNPFIMKFSTVGSNDNSIGAIVGGPSEDPTTFAMRPMLSVVETKPVTSLLDIFWESTMCGKLETLNSYITSSVNNVIATNINSGSFSENTASLANVGSEIKFINGSGAESSDIVAVSITKVVSQNNPSIPLTIADFFTVALIGNSGTGTAAQIKTAKTFWYSVNSNNIPSSDVYIFDLEVSTVGSGSQASPEFTDVLPACFTLTLDNEAPVIYEDANYTTATGAIFNIPNPAVIDTNIVQLYALNGSVDQTVEDSTQNRTKEIVWSITAVTPSANTSDFAISSSGLITTNTTLTNEQAYTIFVKVQDVNATGSNSLQDLVTIAFTAGTANAPKIIGSGSTIGSTAQRNAVKGQTIEFAWINSNTYAGSATGSPFGTQPTFVYNAQRIYNITSPGAPNSCSGTGRSDLFQGTIEIKPKIFNTNTFNGDSTILFSIQYRTYNLVTGARGSWENINSVAAGAGYATWSSTQSQQQITHSTVNANQETAFKYKFDELGEYRVITNALGGDSTVGLFTVDFKDGTYANNAGPCTP
tara:strand:- start:2865 stop:7469 length:4605 start_codon:yes stop_codon:yes gene_type:complete